MKIPFHRKSWIMIEYFFFIYFSYKSWKCEQLKIFRFDAFEFDHFLCFFLIISLRKVTFLEHTLLEHWELIFLSVLRKKVHKSVLVFDAVAQMGKQQRTAIAIKSAFFHLVAFCFLFSVLFCFALLCVYTFTLFSLNVCH